MPSEVKIAAEPRTEFGKGAARRIRRANKVPAVLYGHGTDPVHITLPGHDLMLALKTANALLSIELAGNSQLALPKQVQRDPIRGFIEHADLLIVRQGEKVTVDVPVLLVGEAAPDTMVSLESPAVRWRSRPPTSRRGSRSTSRVSPPGRRSTRPTSCCRRVPRSA